jgi:hypothetical protein
LIRQITSALAHYGHGSLSAAGRQFALDNVQLLPSITPENIIGVGANYRAIESNETGSEEPVL